MNATEKHRICDLIAGWEWGDYIDGIEGRTRSLCAKGLREALNISDAEFTFYRAWAIMERGGIDPDEDRNQPTFNRLLHLIETLSHEAVIDRIEAAESLEAYLRALDQKGGAK